MKGYIGHTDPGWWSFLQPRPELREVNFWRPGGRRFSALSPGEPFFFRLKSPINRIGGFGLFARYASLPVWRAWEVFGQANGTRDEPELLDRLARLARRQVRLSDSIGCVAVTDCTFFEPDAWLDVPLSFKPQNCPARSSTSSGLTVVVSGQPASNKPRRTHRHPRGCQTRPNASGTVARRLSSLGSGKDRSGSRFWTPTVAGAPLRASTRCRLSRPYTSALMRLEGLTNSPTACRFAETYTDFLTWATSRSRPPDSSWSALGCAPNSPTATRTTPSRVNSFGSPSDWRPRRTRNSSLGTPRRSFRPRST